MVTLAAAAAVTAAFATARGLLLTTARRFLFATTGRLFLGTAARRFAAAATVVVEQTAVAAAAAVAEETAMAAAAAMTTERVRLRFQADQNDGHGRQSQYQLQYIALHQKYLQTHGQKVETINRVVIARWTTNEDLRSC
jgi:hypothetical protein